MILSAQTIRQWCLHVRPMISPFIERTVTRGKTFGLSAAGYDVRIDLTPRVRLLMPGEFILASTIEHFELPALILGVVHDKSSWARRGLSVFNTIIEPGWRGYLTLELANHGHEEITLSHEDPIAQIVFHRLDKPTDQPYSGKYQDQARGPQPAIDEVS
jgi:dCTP deaminase